MSRRTATYLVLASFLNLSFSGCTKTVTVSLYESGHLRHNAITGVVLKTGEQETLNQCGGRFDPGSEKVTGVTTSGDSAEYKLGELSDVRVIARASGLALTLDVPSQFFPGYYKNPKPGKITYVMTHDGLRHVFDKRGGSINIATSTITGRNRFRTPFSVALADVDQVGVQKPDKLATTLLVVGIGAVITGVVLAIMFHDFDPMPGWEIDF